jgi:hypothetical protein
VARPDLLEGHLAVQFLVLGHEHLTEAAAGVRPEDVIAQPGPRARGCVRRARDRPEVRPVERPGRRHGCLKVRIAQVVELLPGLRPGRLCRSFTSLIAAARGQRPHSRRRQGRQALPGIPLVGVEVLLHQDFQNLTPPGGQLALLDQHLAERPGLVQHPGVHGGDQGGAVDEVHLEGHDAEEQIAVGGVGSRGKDVGHGNGPPGGG